jgi:hypothetical protein
MTSALDEKWRPFNCFFQSGRAKDLSAPLYTTAWVHAARISIYLNIAHETGSKSCGALPPLFVYFWRNRPPNGPWPHSTRLLDYTQQRNTVGRTPLDGWSARRRYLYLTTNNSHNRQTSIPPVGFEPPISAGEPLQNHALDHVLLIPLWWWSCPGRCRTGWFGDAPPAQGVGGSLVFGLTVYSLSWEAWLVVILMESVLRWT